MNRASLPHRILSGLALLASLLLVGAPPVSRWMQSQPAPVAVEPALHHPAPSLNDAHAHAGHDMQAMAAAAGHPGAHAAGAPTSSPAMPDHAAHGPACDYCLLAARLLLPGTFAVSLPAPPPPARSRHAAAIPVPPLAGRWPAHAPRGPPPHA